MSLEIPDSSAVLTRYLEAPIALSSAVGGLTGPHFDLARTEGKWTIRQIVHHIVDADHISTILLKAALGREHCVIDYSWYDVSNAWAETLYYAHRSVEPAVALFRANHTCFGELLERVQNAFERVFTLKHPAFANLPPLGVGQVVHLQTEHAFAHLEQIRQTRERHGV